VVVVQPKQVLPLVVQPITLSQLVLVVLVAHSNKVAQTALILFLALLLQLAVAAVEPFNKLENQVALVVVVVVLVIQSKLVVLALPIKDLLVVVVLLKILKAAAAVELVQWVVVWRIMLQAVLGFLAT
jgi:hypothetical protein